MIGPNASLDLESIRARPGSRISDKDAVRIAPELFDIEKRDGLATAEAILERAKDPDNPLHKFFEWDDSKAANENRLATARTLAKSITYRVLIAGREIASFQPALVRVKEVDNGGVKRIGYVSITRAMQEDHLREQVIRNAQRDAESFIRRYKTIEALAGVMPIAEQLHQELQNVKV